MVREALAFEDVHVSGRATEALELVRDRDFALVLCELSICPTTGIALFEQLVRLRPELADRFVLLTRARGLAGVPLSIGQHEIRMLCKPFGSRELDELLGRAQLALEA
jgi:DNA-binding NtrC family response regulator